MDLRSIINKLDTIDQRRLLKEAEDVLEAIQGIQYSDVEALARTLPPPKDTERATALGKLARDNNLPGLFDPFTNKFVNADGAFAKIGAYSSEIDTLKSKGLMPLGAETSNWGMGQDRAAAQAGNLSAQDIIKKAYRADAIMDLALPKLAQPGIGQTNGSPAPVVSSTSGQSGAPANESISLSSGIATGLLEEFGYSKAAIVEAIDRTQHQELKKLITDLTPYQGSNHHVAQVMVQWAAYNRERDRLIIRIMKLIERLKRRIKPRVMPVAKESINESNQGQWIYHSGLREDETLKFSNTKTGKVFTVGTIIEDTDGTWYMLAEAEKSKDKKNPERGVLQRVDDTIRAVANTWTGGWTDNLEARVNSWANRTSYGSELKKSIARTNAATKSALFKFTDPIFKKTWEPSAYDLGVGAGALTMFPRLGIVGTATLIAADMAQNKLLRQPHNKAYIDDTKFGDEVGAAVDDVKKMVGLGGDKKADQGGKALPGKVMPFSKETQDLQRQLMAILGPDAVGPKKDDGRLGPDTEAAIKKVVAQGYTLKDGKIVKAAVTPQASAAQDSNTTTSAGDVTQDAGITTSAGGSSVVASAEPEVDTSAIVAEIQKSLGVPETGTFSKTDIAAFGKYTKQAGGDSYDALNKLVGGEVAESRLSQGERMSLLMETIGRLDEGGGGAGWAILGKIFGGAEKEVAATAKGAERVVPKTTPKGTVNKAKPDNPNIAAQVKPAQTRSGYGVGSQPTQFAKFENSAVGALTKAVDDMIRGGGSAATRETIEAAAKGFTERFGFAAGRAFRTAITGGGKVLRFMKNRKWLIAFLLLAAAGYAWLSSDSEDDTPVGPVTPVAPVPVDGKCPAGWKLSADGTKCEKAVPGEGGKEDPNSNAADNEEDASELRELLKELIEGWPDDAQTSQTVEAAKTVGVDMSTPGAGTSGQGGKAANDAEALRKHYAAGTTYDQSVRNQQNR